MHHGSRLIVGDAVLRLRLFVGLETARPVEQPEEPLEVTAEEDAPLAAMDWQSVPYIYHQIPGRMGGPDGTISAYSGHRQRD